jgi:hypothetical protein
VKPRHHVVSPARTKSHLGTLGRANSRQAHNIIHTANALGWVVNVVARADCCCVASQVVDFGFESGIVDLQVGEATVGSMELTFLDPKTNGPKTQGATKPSVIERHLTTQVC